MIIHLLESGIVGIFSKTMDKCSKIADICSEIVDIFFKIVDK